MTAVRSCGRVIDITPAGASALGFSGLAPVGRARPELGRLQLSGVGCGSSRRKRVQRFS